MITADSRLGERLHRAADPLPLDVEARLEGSRRRAHTRHVRRRVSAGAIGLAIVVIGAVVVWDLRDVAEPVPLVPPRVSGTLVYTTSEEDGWDAESEPHELRVSAPGAAVAPPSLSVVGNPISFSPDGSRVASFVPTGEFMKDNWEFANLVVQRLPDSTPEVLVHRVAAAGTPVWGPGGRLAFWTYAKAFGESFELQIVEPDGTVGEPLLHANGVPAVAWSPDGSAIAVGLDDASVVQEFGGLAAAILFMDADGREIRQVYWPGDAINWMSWSPDGSQLAFLTYIPQEGDMSNGVIWVMNPDGSDLRPVTPEDESSGRPVWSPDGEWIAFTSDREMTDAQRRANHRRAFGNDRTPFEGVGLYAMRPDGSDVTPLDTDGAGTPELLAWLGTDPSAGAG